MHFQLATVLADVDTPLHPRVQGEALRPLTSNSALLTRSPHAHQEQCCPRKAPDTLLLSASAVASTSGTVIQRCASCGNRDLPTEGMHDPAVVVSRAMQSSPRLRALRSQVLVGALAVAGCPMRPRRESCASLYSHGCFLTLNAYLRNGRTDLLPLSQYACPPSLHARPFLQSVSAHSSYQIVLRPTKRAKRRYRHTHSRYLRLTGKQSKATATAHWQHAHVDHSHGRPSNSTNNCQQTTPICISGSLVSSRPLYDAMLRPVRELLHTLDSRGGPLACAAMPRVVQSCLDFWSGAPEIHVRHFVQTCRQTGQAASPVRRCWHFYPNETYRVLDEHDMVPYVHLALPERRGPGTMLLNPDVGLGTASASLCSSPRLSCRHLDNRTCRARRARRWSMYTMMMATKISTMPASGGALALACTHVVLRRIALGVQRSHNSVYHHQRPMQCRRVHHHMLLRSYRRSHIIQCALNVSRCLTTTFETELTSIKRATDDTPRTMAVGNSHHRPRRCR
ncbi:hypothetical protein C8Q73DRAFT_699121 [Cubamyces lactineus]|nr:hypothetical protein C8Q73DRAFT_699121 [Cubamyces lactineus]